MRGVGFIVVAEAVAPAEEEAAEGFAEAGAHFFLGKKERRWDGMAGEERNEMGAERGEGRRVAGQQLVEMKDCSVLLDAMRLLE